MTTDALSFSFPDSLTVQHIENVHSELLEWTKTLSASSVTLNMSSLKRIDSSGYQLLISLLKSLTNRQIAVSVVGASAEIVRQCRQCGDTQLLALLDIGDE